MSSLEILNNKKTTQNPISRIVWKEDDIMIPDI